MIQANTDVDSIVVSWGDSVDFEKKQRTQLALTHRMLPIRQFLAYTIVEKKEEPKTSDTTHELHLADIVVRYGKEIKDRVWSFSEQKAE